LIKVGPANTGQFYWPTTDLVLNEDVSNTPSSSVRWLKAKNVGESCDTVCSANSLACDATALAAGVDKMGVENNIIPNYLCK